MSPFLGLLQRLVSLASVRVSHVWQVLCAWGCNTAGSMLECFIASLNKRDRTLFHSRRDVGRGVHRQ